MLFFGKFFARIANYLLYFLVLQVFAKSWISEWVIELSYYKICFGFSLFGLDIIFYNSEKWGRQTIKILHSIAVITIGVFLVLVLWEAQWALLSALSISVVRIEGVLLRRNHKLGAVLLEDLYPVLLLLFTTALVYYFDVDFFKSMFFISLVSIAFLCKNLFLNFSIPRIDQFDWSIIWISIVNALFVYLNYINRQNLSVLDDDAVINFQFLFQIFLLINIILQALQPNLLLKFDSREFEPLLGFVTVLGALLTVFLGIVVSYNVDIINDFFSTRLNNDIVSLYTIMSIYSVLFYYEMFMSNVYNYSRKLGALLLLSVFVTNVLLNTMIFPFWGYVMVQALSIIVPFVISSLLYNVRQTLIRVVYGLVLSLDVVLIENTIVNMAFLVIPISFVFYRWKLYRECRVV